jgi:hypothetical protein
MRASSTAAGPQVRPCPGCLDCVTCCESCRERVIDNYTLCHGSGLIPAPPGEEK